MQTEKCHICAILPDQKPLLKADYWVVCLAPDQGYLGRCYVTIKEHKGSLAEISEQEWQEFGQITKALELGLKQATGAALFNWSCLTNNAYQSSDPTPHIHWHVRPRYEQSVNFCGKEFQDPAFGHHYDRNQRFYPEEAVLDSIREKIRAKL